MPLQYDEQYGKAIEPLLPLLAGREQISLDNIESSRDTRETGVAALINQLPEASDVVQTEYEVEAADGYRIPIIGFAKKNHRSESSSGSAVLHCHGGGMIMGRAQMFAKSLSLLVERSGVPIFSVNYRLAPEYNGTTAVEDSYMALTWLYANAHKFSIDTTRIGIFGESAGGGLAAGVALMARDRNLQPPLAKQILAYPMLDDCNMDLNPELDPLAFWKNHDNIIAWTALLGAYKAGNPNADVSPYAAPARAQSLKGLPPTYMDVGELDIFREEDIRYVLRLVEQNIPTEFHLYPGVPHAFEVVAPQIDATRRAFENRVRALLSF